MAVWYAQYVEKSIVFKQKNNSSCNQIGDLKEIHSYSTEEKKWIATLYRQTSNVSVFMQTYLLKLSKQLIQKNFRPLSQPIFNRNQFFSQLLFF